MSNDDDHFLERARRLADARAQADEEKAQALPAFEQARSRLNVAEHVLTKVDEALRLLIRDVRNNEREKERAIRASIAVAAQNVIDAWTSGSGCGSQLDHRIQLLELQLIKAKS